MIRVRYSRTENGNLISKPMICAGDSVVSTISPIEDGFSFAITSVSTGEMLTGGSSNSLTYVKTLAKQALIGIGVVFSDEVRTKTQTDSTTQAA